MKLPDSHPWVPEKELWPLPGWIPAEEVARFPAEEAVDLLMSQVASNFETLDLARESAIGFVNHRRREMAEQYGLGIEG